MKGKTIEELVKEYPNAVVIRAKLPPWVSAETLKGTSELLSKTLLELRSSPKPIDAFRAFLSMAVKEGYPVQGFFADPSDPEKLLKTYEEHTIRAYWWKFERMCWDKEKKTGGSA